MKNIADIINSTIPKPTAEAQGLAERQKALKLASIAQKARKLREYLKQKVEARQATQAEIDEFIKKRDEQLKRFRELLQKSI